MSFFSFYFLIFVAVLILVSYRCVTTRCRRLVLSLANLVFVLTYIPSLNSGLALAAFVLVSYGFLIAIRRWPGLPLPTLGIVLALLGLMLVKRYEFLRPLLPGSWLNHGLELIGISYMVFKWIQMAVDLRQVQLAPVTLYGYVNFQLGFFSLVAGPIQRYNDFQRFWQERPLPFGNPRDALLAWSRILTGLFKLGVFGALLFMVCEYGRGTIVPGATTGQAILGFLCMFYGYPVYIYLNFSGYCDVVIGAARLLGMVQQENFDRPYRARDMVDFWNRWHISLTFWIRDYVFMTSYKWVAEHWPRAAQAAGYFLLFVALFLAGVWHGPSLNFVVFGLLHGLGIAISRAYGDSLRKTLGHLKYKQYLANRWIHAVAILLTLHYVSFCFLFFTPDMNDTFQRLSVVWSKVL